MPPAPHLSSRCGGRLEHDDLAPAGVAQPVEEAVREHPVGEARLAADGGLGAVQRGLHRRRRDAVRVDDERLDEQHDRHGTDDRDDPVDRDAKRVGQAARQPVDRVPRLPVRRMIAGGRPGGAPAGGENPPSPAWAGLGPALILGSAGTGEALPLRQVGSVRRRPGDVDSAPPASAGTAAPQPGPVTRNRLRRQRRRGPARAHRLGASAGVRRHAVVRRPAPAFGTHAGPAGSSAAAAAGRCDRIRRRPLRRSGAVGVLGAVLGVAHATLRTRLCSARQPSIRAWLPDRSTSGTSQPRNSAGRV